MSAADPDPGRPDPDVTPALDADDAATDPGLKPAREPTGAPEVLEVDAPRTDVSVVDDVLASLAGVEQRPLEDQVEAFEDAQRGLRRALEDPSDGPSGAPSGD